MKRTGTEEARGSKPRAFTLELTKGCNLRCGYCYYAGRDDAYDPKMRMSPEVAEQSVDVLLAEAAAGESAHLHFFGGEPLLNFATLASTVHYAERRAAEEGKSMTFEVTTNGTRLTDEVIAFLNEHDVQVGVSFDGPPEVQDAARPAAAGSSYALAEPGIRKLLASRKGKPLAKRTHCSVVVTRECDDLVYISQHLEGFGFENIILTPATDLEGESHGFREQDIPRVLEKYSALAESYEASVRTGAQVAPNWYPTLMERLLSGERKMHFCGGGRDYLGVAADGKVNLCYRFYEDDEFAMGSVQDGITSEVTERLDEHALDSRTTCSKCWARYFCGGGCHHDNVTVSGELGDPNPVTCEIFRHSMGLTLDAWARLSRLGKLEGRRTPAGDPRHSEAAHMDDSEATAPFDADAKPMRVAGCHARELDGEKVVYDPATHEVCVLNPTAAFIFELCDGAATVADIRAALEERYDAPAEVLGRDLDATLTLLREKRLVGA